MRGESDARATIIREHEECLSAVVQEVDQLMADSGADDLGQAGVGLGLVLVMFAGELAFGAAARGVRRRAAGV